MRALLNSTYKFYRYNIKYNIYLCITLFIIMILNLLMSVLFNIILDRIYMISSKAYGTHNVIAYNVNQDTVREIESENTDFAANLLTLYGNYDIVSTDLHSKLTVGAVDSDEFMENLLLKGTIPHDNKGIIINNRYSSFFKIGDTVELNYDGQNYSYIISGWIEDYKDQWDVPDIYLKGINDFPDAFILFDKAMKPKSINALFYNEKFRQTGKPLTDSFMKALIKTGKDFLINKSFNYGDFYTLFDKFGTLEIIIRTIILIFESCCLFIGMKLFKNSKYQSFQNMLKQGMIKSGVRCICIGMYILDIFVSFSSLILIQYLVFNSGTNSYLYLCKAFLFNSLIIIIYGLGMKIDAVKDNNRGLSDSKEESIMSKLLSFQISKDTWSMIFTLVFTVSILMTSNFISADIYNMRRLNSMKYNVLSASIDTNWRSLNFGDFEYYSLNRSFGPEMLEWDNNSNCIIDKRVTYGGNAFSVVMNDVSDPYWNYYYSMTKDDDCLDISPIGNSPKGIKGIKDICYVEIISNEKYAEFVNSDNTNGIILYCPPISDYLGQTLNQTYYKTGDNFIVGYLYSDNNYDDIEKDFSLLSYKEEIYRVQKVVYENYRIAVGDSSIEMIDYPVVVMSTDTAKRSCIANKILGVSLFLNRTISNDDYNDLSDIFRFKCDMYDGVQILDSKERSDLRESIIKTLSLVSNMTVLTVQLVIVMIVSVVYAQMLSINSRYYRLLVSVGMSNGHFKKILYLEETYYYVISVLIYIIMAFTFVPMYCQKALNLILSRKELVLVIASGLCYLGVQLGLLTIVLKRIMNKYYKIFEYNDIQRRA